MNHLENLNINIFADGANVNEMKKLYKEGIVNGFTTNPTLMRNDGVTNYEEFAKEVLSEITDMPISSFPFWASFPFSVSSLLSFWAFSLSLFSVFLLSLFWVFSRF